ncbi:single-stranded DNA-binding protein, mitochondrial [Agrilus planipennis]|uniref:Single-stranded DNA-binding protein, mitochondrial n=1 Tax=Agrilus planipennis TaxID=224129 RepID=A0A1W4WP28_AGRPL|nr:single-stranded DNA-binding protein, mitochondrial [Agrilus planipennis]XP_018325679.1 single-stranded DNA-binding protein, mitochondrial [Agrilus planipennis]
MLANKVLNFCCKQKKLFKSFNVYASTSTTASQEPSRIEKSLNHVQLLGRVGADPQRKGSDDHPVVVFSMATNSNYRYETGEFLQRTEWHRVVCFKPGLRETILNYLKKGQRVFVTGRVTYGEVKGDDGKPRTTAAIAADDVIFFQS